LFAIQLDAEKYFHMNGRERVDNIYAFTRQAWTDDLCAVTMSLGIDKDADLELKAIRAKLAGLTAAWSTFSAPSQPARSPLH
jgi:hypothetical protein